MKIDEIAKRLDDCANNRCKESQCKYIKDDCFACQKQMIREMGEECRKLVEQMGDDGK